MLLDTEHTPLKVPTQRRGKQLMQRLRLRRALHAKTVPARAEKVKVPAQRTSKVPAQQFGMQLVQHLRRANRGSKFRVQEARRLCGGAGSHQRGSRAGRDEHFGG